LTGIKPSVAGTWLPEKSENITEESLHEFFGIRREKIEELREKAKEAIEKAQAGFLARQKKRPGHIYKIGDKVWIKHHTASKWQPKYHGPYIIESLVSDVIIKIKDTQTGKEDCVHTDYAKPFISRDGSPFVPALEKRDENKERLHITSQDEEKTSKVILENVAQPTKEAVPSPDPISRREIGNTDSPSTARRVLRSMRRLFSSDTRSSEPEVKSPKSNSSNPTSEVTFEFPSLPEQVPVRFTLSDNSETPPRRRHNPERILLDENQE
jgi:hypothetical protein